LSDKIAQHNKPSPRIASGEASIDIHMINKEREQEAIQREVQNHIMKRKSVIHQGEADIFEDFRRALNLNHEDVRKLDDFKKLSEIEWFIEVAQLGDG
jgi:hypothetical protein